MLVDLLLFISYFYTSSHSEAWAGLDSLCQCLLPGNTYSKKGLAVLDLFLTQGCEMPLLWALLRGLLLSTNLWWAQAMAKAMMGSICLLALLTVPWILFSHPLAGRLPSTEWIGLSLYWKLQKDCWQDAPTPPCLALYLTAPWGS